MESNINGLLNLFKRKHEVGRNVSEYYVSGDTPLADTAGIVLKSDTYLELGAPGVGSCAFTVYSYTAKAVEDGRIRLIGMEMKQSETPYSFGQVIIARGKLDRKAAVSFSRCHHQNPGIEGYMVKGSVKNVWSRVSKSLGESGFGFKELGNALVTKVKKQFPTLEAVEVLFVSSSAEDVVELNTIADAVQAEYQMMKEQVWSARGINIYGCAFHGNCDSCGDKKACDGIRAVAKTRKARAGQG